LMARLACCTVIVGGVKQPNNWLVTVLSVNG
jgi:hypothetical protein